MAAPTFQFLTWMTQNDPLRVMGCDRCWSEDSRSSTASTTLGYSFVDKLPLRFHRSAQHVSKMISKTFGTTQASR
jgi:hypothetical protein